MIFYFLFLFQCDILNEYKGILSCECFKRIKSFFKRPLKKDEVDFVSAPFETDIKFIFKNFDHDIENSKGFNESIRCLLVDQILTNLNINISNKPNDERDTSLRSALIKKLINQVDEDDRKSMNRSPGDDNQDDNEQLNRSTGSESEDEEALAVKTMISSRLNAITGK